MPDAAKSTSLSGNAVIDGLMLGGAWSGPTITYSFLTGDINKNGVSDFNEGDWKSFYREITGNVESFTNVKFKEVAGRGNINFRLDEGGGGESGVPTQGTTDVETAVGINPDVAGAAAVVRLGTYSVTWFHEIGHALGLKHTHDDEGGAFPKLPGVSGPSDQGTTYLNSQINTVMGYTSSFLAEDNPFTAAVDFGVQVNAQPGSYGAIDIAALQFLYGARAYNTGNDTYRFNDNVDFNRGYSTIWDTDGADTIEYTGTSRTKIDLRAATLQNEIGGGGWISTSETLTGGFTIANGVTIENAKGNSADDILIGNNAANTLTGFGGNDTLLGNAGDDRLNGGDGNDVIDGGAGTDSAIYGKAFATYAVRAEGVTTVIVGEGVDRLQNIEKAIFSDGIYDFNRKVFDPTVGTPANVLIGTDRADTLTATTTAAWTLNGLGGNDILVGNINNDRLNGGLGADRLDGGAGKDWLDGGIGNDVLRGGTGSDLFVFDNLRTSGVDTISDFGSNDVILTTRKIRDSNGDGIITFGSNNIVNLDTSSRGDRLFIEGLNQHALEYDGTIDSDGVKYYVYSAVGSAVNTLDII